MSSNTSSSNGLFNNLPNVSSASAADSTDLPLVDELAHLKQKAAIMGISHSNNIGVEALRAKINAKLAGEDQAELAAERQAQEEAEKKLAEQDAAARAAALVAPAAGVIPAAGSTTPTPDPVPSPEVSAAPARPKTPREILLESEMALIRVRITNLDPKKKDLPGEIITVANEVIGTVRKYVPFGEKTDDGWHVPRVILRVLQERTFPSITVPKKDGREGHPVVRDAREFAIEILDPLTPEELTQLAATQAAAGIV